MLTQWLAKDRKRLEHSVQGMSFSSEPVAIFIKLLALEFPLPIAKYTAKYNC